MISANRLRYRTLPVFVVGVGSLLALLFLPGFVALRRTAAVYHDIRRIQDGHQRTQQALADIERRLYLISITVREVLLDTSAGANATYRNAFHQYRRDIEDRLNALKRESRADTRLSIPRLEHELQQYFIALEPVFGWSPEQRSSRALYFLREQQRPRRQSIIQIADEIGRLTEASYSQQLDQVNNSQIQFGADIERVIVVAFLIGVIISIWTAARIATLEDRSERQRVNTEQAEEQLRSLSMKLMQTQEEERKTIARELHDEVGQTLTGLRLGLGGLDRLAGNKEALQEQTAELKSLAEQTLRAVRDIAVGLRPSVLDLGLVPAIQWQARRFSTYSGVPATVSYRGASTKFPRNTVHASIVSFRNA